MRNRNAILTHALVAVISVMVPLLGLMVWTWRGGNPRGNWVLVTDVIDGDTIYVGRWQRHTKVRLIGVDTPEIPHPGKPEEFWGPEASEFSTNQLKGQKVHLEFEPSHYYDKYRRLLAYVYLPDGTLFNAELIKEGYARVMAPSTFRYEKEFRDYEQAAKQARLGLWSGETEAPPLPAKAKTGEGAACVAPQAKPAPAPAKVSAKIVGNRQSMIYHLPGHSNYSRIKDENRVYFDSEEEAQKAGYRPAKN